MTLIKKNWLTMKLYILCRSCRFSFYFPTEKRNHLGSQWITQFGQFTYTWGIPKSSLTRALSSKNSFICQCNSPPSWKLGVNHGRSVCGSSYHRPFNKFDLLHKSPLGKASKQNSRLDYMCDYQSQKTFPFLFSTKSLAGACFPHSSLVTAVPEGELHVDYT